jgi:hypothetical protein
MIRKDKLNTLRWTVIFFNLVIQVYFIFFFSWAHLGWLEAFFFIFLSLVAIGLSWISFYGKKSRIALIIIALLPPLWVFLAYVLLKQYW